MSSFAIVKDGIEKCFEFDLDLKRPTQYEEIMLVEGDTKNRFIVHLMDDGEPVDLTGCKVMLTFSHGGGTTYQDSSARGGQVTVTGNTVDCKLLTGSFSDGLVECEVRVYSGVNFGQTTSSRFNFMCRRSILNEQAAESEIKDSPFLGLIEQANEAIRKAQQAIVDANLALEGAKGNGNVNLRVHLHIRYCDRDPVQAGFNNVTLSRTPAEFIGLCVTDSQDAPEKASEYIWYRWKGERGERGEQGTSSKLHIRYAPTDPKLTSVKPTEVPGRYMGVCVTDTDTAPTDSGAYNWIRVQGEDGASVTGVETRNGNIVFRLSDNNEVTIPANNVMNSMSSASQSAPGLMSSGDKAKLDELRAFSHIAFSDSEHGSVLDAGSSGDTALINLGEHLSFRAEKSGVTIDVKTDDKSGGFMSANDKYAVDRLFTFLWSWGSDGLEEALNSFIAHQGMIMSHADKAKLDSLRNYSGIRIESASSQEEGYELAPAKADDTLKLSFGSGVLVEKTGDTLTIDTVPIEIATNEKAGLMSPMNKRFADDISALLMQFGPTFELALQIYVRQVARDEISKAEQSK